MRIHGMMVVAALLAVSAGCAICDPSLDAMYPTYGGKWQRSDPCCGRVGSAFDSAGGPLVESWVEDMESAEPTYAEELQEGELVAPPSAGDAASPAPLPPGTTPPSATSGARGTGALPEMPGELPGPPSGGSRSGDEPPSPESVLRPR